MAPAQKSKVSDKQRVIKKTISLLKKRYKSAPRHDERPVLENFLYAICLENSSLSQAEATYARIGMLFHDLNEVRVSSISELAEIFKDLSDPEWRALRVRSILQYVFEKSFSFEFESLRRKTLELAARQLARIKELSPFVRTYVLQETIGAHLVPVDEQMTNAAIWLGFVDPDADPEQASESLKSTVRKADAPLFCHLLRCLACDQRVNMEFQSIGRKAVENPFQLETAPERLEALFKRPPSRSKPTKGKTKGAKKAAARRTAAKKSAAGSAKKTASRRAAAKSASGRKPARKTTSRKAGTKKKK